MAVGLERTTIVLDPILICDESMSVRACDETKCAYRKYVAVCPRPFREPAQPSFRVSSHTGVPQVITLNASVQYWAGDGNSPKAGVFVDLRDERVISCRQDSAESTKNLVAALAPFFQY